MSINFDYPFSIFSGIVFDVVAKRERNENDEVTRMVKTKKRDDTPSRKSAKSSMGAGAVIARSPLFLHPMTFLCVDFFLTAAIADGLAKGQRTLLRLKAGTAQALNDIPYPALRVADIVERAGLSYGLFYHYFKDKETAVKSVLSDMLDHVENTYRNIHSSENDYESMFEPNLFYVEYYSHNAGLMSACLSLSEEDQEFGDLWNRANDSWHRRIANGIRIAQHQNKSLLPEADLVAYTLGGMVDQICRQIFVQKNPFAARLVKDNLKLAEAVSILWYRAVYGRDPNEDQVLACREKFAVKHSK
jgi:AcrR family transcriptional regulator